MLLGDVAVPNLALALWAQKSRVDQDDAPNDRGGLTRHHGRSQASHRMPEQNRSAKPKPSDEPNDIASVILVPVAMGRCARGAVSSGVRHHDIIFTLERAS